ncbi:hypothetical protein CEQ90_04595 [Lewinellaceae bacterium SD302]|nr:hypothetical protein CEQ90_04595 [Lewinellaceae bacterium SD302]
MLNKYTAGILAIILGGFGLHRFYLGQRFFGILRFAAFVLLTLITIESNEDAAGFLLGMLFLSAAIEGLIFLVMPKDRFNAKYNKHHTKVTAPANVADLKAEGVEYFRSGDYDLATEAFRDALEVNASDPGVHFNLACAYSKSHALIPALHHLELAVSYGLPEPKRIDTHPALEWLRAQSLYQAFKNQNYRQQLLLDAPMAPIEINMAEPEEIRLDLPDIKDIPVAEDDLVTRIRKLGKLREQGIITEAEFAEQKEKILS